ATLCRSCGATEVVERHGRDPTLGEAQRQLLVEPVETANVREDHDAHVAGLFRCCSESGEAVSIARLEDEILMRDAGAANHRDRRHGVELEAHCRASLAQKS